MHSPTDSRPARPPRPFPFPLFGHGITGQPGPEFRPRSIGERLSRVRCLAVGCEYRTNEFRSWCLYACARCGCEMFGRGFADIPPAPADDDLLGGYEANDWSDDL